MGSLYYYAGPQGYRGVCQLQEIQLKLVVAIDAVLVQSPECSHRLLAVRLGPGQEGRREEATH